MSIEPNRIEFVISDSSLAHESSSSSSCQISVLLDGDLRPGWRFDLFWIDYHHVACLAKGPSVDAVDFHRDITNLSVVSSFPPTIDNFSSSVSPSSLPLHSDSNALSSTPCLAAAHARSNRIQLFEVISHDDVSAMKLSPLPIKLC